MPETIEDFSVSKLLDIADGTDTSTDYTPEEAFEELRYRIVPNDYVTEEMRGGIRPTHIPTH